MPVRNAPHPNTASDASAVTPADGTDLTPPCIALYVGTGGNVRVTTLGGSDITFTNVASGAVLPIGASRVWATNTTATGIVALY